MAKSNATKTLPISTQDLPALRKALHRAVGVLESRLGELSGLHIFLGEYEGLPGLQPPTYLGKPITRAQAAELLPDLRRAAPAYLALSRDVDALETGDATQIDLQPLLARHRIEAVEVVLWVTETRSDLTKVDGSPDRLIEALNPTPTR